MSPHTRWACAVCALGMLIPVSSALADASTGGTSYGAKPASAGKKPARGHQHLGDRVPVRRGMRGHDVKILQDFINRIGLRVAIDGSFGRQTYAALRRFEKRTHQRVDGVLSADDLTELRKVLADGGFPAPRQPAELPAGSRAKVNRSGLAAAPADAPKVVKRIIAAGNRIASKPYVYGGGHGKWNDSGYDCSGSVSYALHGAGLLKASRASGGFTTFGQKGYGKWVTLFANGGHMYMVVAGLRFDTSGASSTGSRWQTAKRSARGYVIRHPRGL